MPRRKDGAGITELLKDVFTQVADLKTFVDLSDRSALPTGYGLEFSAAIRQCPRPDSLISVYMIRLSIRSNYGPK